MESRCQCYLHHQTLVRCNIHTTLSNVAFFNGPTITMYDLFSSMPYHAVFGFLNPLLLGFLQVSVQGTTKSLFETHSTNMWTFLLSTIVYSFSFAAEMKYRHYDTSYSQVFGAIAITSGSISSISLVSMIIPRSGEHMSYIACTFVPIVVAYRHAILAKDAYNWICQKIYGLWDKFNGRYSMEWPQLPV